MPVRPRETPPSGWAAMEDGMATWQRLQQWAAAAELLYAPNSPVTVPPVAGEPQALVVARRIATAMARLNSLCEREAQVVLTPREALLELAETMRFALISFRAEVLSEPPGSPRVAGIAASYVAQRSVPRAGIIEGLHVATWVSVKLRVEFFVEQLRQRLQCELAEDAVKVRSAEMVTALRATQTLLGDFETLYESVLVTFPCVQLLDSSPTVSASLLPVLAKQYYQLAEWVAEVETSTSLPPITETRVESIDESTSTVVLSRTDVSSPWGLLFNDCGFLVDVDISLRGASPEGEELHRMLRRSGSRVAVVAVNSTEVPRARKDVDAAVVCETIARATRDINRLVIRVSAEAFHKPRVKQLAFFVPDQGREGSSGQRATIVLHRTDRRLAWDCLLSDDLIVQSISRHSLSAEAKAFFAEYKKRVRLMAINGVELTTPEQTAALAAATETLVLNLVVAPPVAQRPAGDPALARVAGLSEAALDPAREAPLVRAGAAQARRGVPAEAVDAAADAPFAADADEAEELAAETPAEEEDVRETVPALADEGEREGGEEEARLGEEEAEADTKPQPLVLEHVTIDELTPLEMVIHRTSTEKKWGLALERMSGKSGIDAIRIKALPMPRSKGKSQQLHPFYQTFEKPPGPNGWRIQSVNGTPSTIVQDVLDVMHRSISMRIRFFKGR